MQSGAVALLAVVLCAAPAFAAKPPALVLAHIRTFVAATQFGAGKVDVDALFTPDAIVVDENPKFLWSGPHAASQWLADLRGMLSSMHVSKFSILASPMTQYEQSGSLAYAIVPLTIDGTAGTKHVHEKGTLTLTFRLIHADWKISSDVWTTQTKSVT